MDPPWLRMTSTTSQFSSAAAIDSGVLEAGSRTLMSKGASAVSSILSTAGGQPRKAARWMALASRWRSDASLGMYREMGSQSKSLRSSS